MKYTALLDNKPQIELVAGTEATLDIRVFEEKSGKSAQCDSADLGIFRFKDINGDTAQIPLTTPNSTLSNFGVLSLTIDSATSSLLPEGNIDAEFEVNLNSGQKVYIVLEKALKVRKRLF